ncbi:MAG: response regulator [Pseudomonadales bacterium]|nr:response regulator [Pseudomonadales bacterium]
MNIACAKDHQVGYQGQESLDLAPFIYYLEDPNWAYDIEAVSSQAFSSRFQRNQAKIFKTLNGESQYWLRISLSPELLDKSFADKWILYLRRQPQIQGLVFYLFESGQEIRRVKTGVALPSTSRDIDMLLYAFRVSITEGKAATIYLQVDNRNYQGITIPLELITEVQLHRRNTFNTGFLGAFYGVMIALFLYNVVLAVRLNDWAHYSYLLLLVIGTTACLAMDGSGSRYVWSAYPQLTPVIKQLGNISICPVHVGFIFLILGLWKSIPKLRSSFIGFISLSSSYLLYAIISGNTQWGFHFIIASFLFGLVYIAMAIYKKIPLAGYLLIAEGSLIAASAASITLHFSSIDMGLESWRMWSVHVGLVLEVLLFSLVLAQRISMQYRQSLQHERKLVEVKQQAIAAYQSSMQLKNDFLSTVSHELRTPMNAIVGGLQLLKKDQLSDESSVDIIYDGADDMMRLVNDILIHAEIQAGKITVRKTDVNSTAFFTTLQHLYQQLCNQKSLTLQWHVTPKVPPWLYTDSQKLSIIITKLMDNAVKYTAQGSLIFHCDYKICDESNTLGQLIIRVEDSGIGMSKADQSKIFESFSQLDTGFQRRYGGLGIGLSICQDLISSMHGQLTLTSQLDKGSSFTVSLPVAPGKAAHHQKPDISHQQRLPILVVEDNIVNQKVMQKILQNLGYHSVIANHGQEALDLLSEQRFSLVLMDLQMPVMDGFSCVEHIRQIPELTTLPVIAVTANLMDADKQRCLEAGMHAFMTKPVKMQELEELLSQFL